jgi:hypothetical protein
MNHLKLYEDFSDEELEGLFNDMSSLGFGKVFIERGQDYGIGKSLDKGPETKYNMYFSQEAVDFLIEKGAVKKTTENYFDFIKIPGVKGLARIQRTKGYALPFILTLYEGDKMWPEKYYKHDKFRSPTLINMLKSILKHLDQFSKTPGKNPI